MTSGFQDFFYSELCNKIKKVRKDLNMTQFDFAEKLGLSRASIVNIEKCRQKPTIHLLYEISLLAQIDMNYFFDSMQKEMNTTGILSRRIEKKLEKELDKKAKNTIIKFLSNIDD